MKPTPIQEGSTKSNVKTHIKEGRQAPPPVAPPKQLFESSLKTFNPSDDDFSKSELMISCDYSDKKDHAIEVKAYMKKGELYIISSEDRKLREGETRDKDEYSFEHIHRFNNEK